MNEKRMNFFKLRTKFGTWLDSVGKSQEWVVSITGLNKETVSGLCNDTSRTPQKMKQLKLIGALRKHGGYDVSVGDFW